MPSITVNINGEEWTLRTTRLKNLYGRCCYDDKAIEIHTGTRGKALLDTLVHELMHAQAPDLAEEAITRRATEIANALWKLGWRKSTVEGP